MNNIFSAEVINKVKKYEFQRKKYTSIRKEE